MTNVEAKARAGDESVLPAYQGIRHEAGSYRPALGVAIVEGPAELNYKKTWQRESNPVEHLLRNCYGVNRSHIPRLLWMANLEAERFWGTDDLLRLPAISQQSDARIISRLEEIVLFLAQQPDLVVLRTPSDPGFLEYLRELRMKPAIAVSPEVDDSSLSISQALLKSPDACRSISAWREQFPGSGLLPYAVTHLEEQVCEATGLALIGPSSDICRRVNSKIYSRQITRELGLHSIPGHECDSLEALHGAYSDLSRSTEGPLVLKEAMGVSGRGISMIDTPEKMDKMLQLLKRSSRSRPRIDFVLERWIDKDRDVNYQISVSPDGHVTLIGIKEAVTYDGVHSGHRWPIALTTEQRECYEEAATAIGKRLHDDGFFGIAGIDSIIDKTGIVYPVLEINARMNMSTFESRIDDITEPATQKILKYYAFQLEIPMNFQDLRAHLGADLFRYGSDRGVGIFCFATANCNLLPEGEPSIAKGRLYAFLIGKDSSELAVLDAKMQAALEHSGARFTHI